MIMLLGTQRGLLELLFEAGLMIMARKAMQPDGPVAIADLHYRRNWLLVLLGLFNGFVLLWVGDILLPYGLTALLLFQFRLIGWRGQLWLAGAFLALSMTVPVHEYIVAPTPRRQRLRSCSSRPRTNPYPMISRARRRNGTRPSRRSGRSRRIPRSESKLPRSTRSAPRLSFNM